MTIPVIDPQVSTYTHRHSAFYYIHNVWNTFPRNCDQKFKNSFQVSVPYTHIEGRKSVKFWLSRKGISQTSEF